ncbi:MAG: lipid-A-disaccharide synthase [Terriglobales bacterium]
MRVLVSAGEASSELYGAQLIEAMRRRVPGSEFFGVGGERMQKAGCDLVVDARVHLSVVGISEIVSKLPSIYAQFRKLIEEVDRRKPEVAVIIDSPAFNFRVARELHKRGIPVVYYVTPQLWAWRQYRVERVRKWVTKALPIFPFEEKFFREHGVDAEYVGHPLADIPPPSISREQFADEFKLDKAKSWIAILPGSRRKEVKMNLPAMLDAAAELGDTYEYLLPVASTIHPGWLASRLRTSPQRIHMVTDSFATMMHSRASIVASGTATVEAALAGTPFVVVYRVSPITWNLGRRLLKVPFVAMPNLIAEKAIVPELLQQDFTSKKVVASLRPLLEEGSARAKMLSDLEAVQQKLKQQMGAGTAADRAADAIMKVMKATPRK